MSEFDTTPLHEALAAEDYPTVIDQARAAIAADPTAAMADPIMQDWIARRYRNIFVDEAVASTEALKHSQRTFPLDLVDRRSDRAKVAQRMFRHIDDAEIAAEMPPAQPGSFADTTLLFCPGLLTGYMPGLAFQQEFPQMVERFGVNIPRPTPTRPLLRRQRRGLGGGDGVGHRQRPDPEGTLLTADDDPPVPGDVILMGYSKGGPTSPICSSRARTWCRGYARSSAGRGARRFVSRQRHLRQGRGHPECAGRGSALRRRRRVGAQVRAGRAGAAAGPPARRVRRQGCDVSLTTGRRDEFNAEHTATLDSYGIPTIYFTGSTSAREVTYFNLQGELELDRYDKLNDMQLTQEQATPTTANAVHAAMWHATHWDMSYDTWPWYDTLGSRS